MLLSSISLASCLEESVSVINSTLVLVKSLIVKALFKLLLGRIFSLSLLLNSSKFLANVTNRSLISKPKILL